MHITRLSLQNFRSYVRLELGLNPGVTLLHGENAQGKTNLLEAIYYLATTRSPYPGQDSQLINWDADKDEMPITVGRIAAELQTEGGTTQIEMRLILEKQRRNGRFRREALVNRRKVRLMDLLTNLQVVQFLPQDIQILTGSPAGRRRYLDITLCQADRVYCRALSTYNKVLEQRNATLRRIAEEGRGADLLPVYNEQLVTLGSEIVLRRARFLANLARATARIHYEELTNGRETIRLGYLPRLNGNDDGQTIHVLQNETSDHATELLTLSNQEIANRLERSLATSRSKDIAKGRTSIGPHRDDWRMWVNTRALESFGSRGQQRTAMLALKLAETEWMTQETGETPILLLDEVMAELDEHRRALLLSYVQKGAQAIMTATDTENFSATFLKNATTMAVSRGQIIRSAPRANGSTALIAGAITPENE